MDGEPNPPTVRPRHPVIPSACHPVIVKVGGSLYDLPDLGDRLRRWLDRQGLRNVLLFPGGGALVDRIRDLDRRHRLGEEHSHWLALRALTVNAHFLAALLAPAAVVTGPAACPELWRHGVLPVADPHALALGDEGRPGQVPHTWDVTSDTLAARAALLTGARELILLKSVSLADEACWAEAVQRGVVDHFFPRLVAAAPPDSLSIRVVNFRLAN
jgi:aspartokinase-like uncharacterized kinase